MFDAHSGLMIWTVISFICLVFLLGKLLFKPLAEALERHTDTIKESIRDAQEARKNAEKTLADSGRLIEIIKDDVKKIIDNGRSEAENLKNEIAKQGDDEAAKIVKNSKEEIAKKRKDNILELRNTIVSQSLKEASKIINRALTKEDHIKLINESVSSLNLNSQIEALKVDSHLSTDNGKNEVINIFGDALHSVMSEKSEGEGNNKELLSDIAEKFLDLSVKTNSMKVELVTAISLSGDMVKQLEQKVENVAQKKIVLYPSVDKRILGGVIFKFGYNVVDASIRNRLETLKEEMTAG